MPTKRTRVARMSADFMTPTHEAWLRGEPMTHEMDLLVYDALENDRETQSPDPPRAVPWLASGITGADLWARKGTEVLAEHCPRFPGSRPAPWWTFQAPEVRRRVGGIGSERSAHAPHFVCGVPADWTAIDPKFPPLYESQASYLDRLGLLSRAERRKLKPADFKPQSILEILGPDAAESSENGDADE
jgi:hypothetical protein